MSNDKTITLTDDEARTLKILLMHEIKYNQKDSINTKEYWDALKSIRNKLTGDVIAIKTN